MKRKVCAIVASIVLVLGLLCESVYAADLSFTASLDTKTKTVEKGKEFTVTLSVSNLNVGTKGINALSGYLTYDDKAFEAVSQDNIEGQNDWSCTYSKDSGKLVFTNPKFVKDETEVAKITLKAKSDISKETKASIGVKTITASNSDSEITADDISVSVTVTGEEAEEGNAIVISSNSNSNKNNSNTNIISISSNSNKNNTNTNSNNTNTDENETNTNSNNTNKNNTNTNNNSNNTNNSNKNNSNINKNESKEDEMPNTGIDDTIVKAMLAVALVSVFGYIKLKSLDRKN